MEFTRGQITRFLVNLNDDGESLPIAVYAAIRMAVGEDEVRHGWCVHQSHGWEWTVLTDSLAITGLLGEDSTGQLQSRPLVGLVSFHIDRITITVDDFSRARNVAGRWSFEFIDGDPIVLDTTSVTSQGAREELEAAGAFLRNVLTGRDSD